MLSLALPRKEGRKERREEDIMRPDPCGRERASCCPSLHGGRTGGGILLSLGRAWHSLSVACGEATRQKTSGRQKAWLPKPEDQASDGGGQAGSSPVAGRESIEGELEEKKAVRQAGMA